MKHSRELFHLPLSQAKFPQCEKPERSFATIQLLFLFLSLQMEPALNQADDYLAEMVAPGKREAIVQRVRINSPLVQTSHPLSQLEENASGSGNNKKQCSLGRSFPLASPIYSVLTIIACLLFRLYQKTFYWRMENENAPSGHYFRSARVGQK